MLSKDLKDEIVNFRPSFTQDNAPANFLLFGYTGTGKTSSINLMRSIKHGIVSTEAPARPENAPHKQHTAAYLRYPFTDGICFWDLWGLGEGKYKAKEFEKMLDGAVSPKTAMPEPHAPMPTQPPNLTFEIDCVLFVVDRFALDLKEDMVRSIKPFFKLAKAKGKVVAVIVTKLDDNGEDGKVLAVEDNPQRLINLLSINKHLRDITNLIHNEWEDTAVRVFPLLNYPANDGMKKSWRERLGYELLKYCITSLKEQYNQEPPMYEIFEKERTIVGRFNPDRPEPIEGQSDST